MIAQNTRILWLPGADERHWDYESGSFGGGRNPAGVRIDPETALRSTVVLACVRVLSSSVAGLPLHLYRRLPDGGKELARDNPLYRVLHDRPNSWQSSYEWREQIMLHLLTHGQAFVEISGAGPQTQLVALHPSRMKVEQIENGRLRYTYREASGSSTVYAQDAIMHLRWLSDDGVNGMVPVELAKDAIGLARACEIHGASFFANGARPGIVLSTDQTLSPEAAMNTRDQWERAHRGPDRAQRTAVLQGGLKVSELGGNNQEAQFLEARRFQVEEVCRIYGVPPHLVGDLSRSSFSNIEQQSLDYVQNGLMPWLRRIESAIARDLVSDDSLFAEFDVRGALRADAAGRASYYNAMWNLGVLSVNEIRAAENLNPVEGGDTRFIQLNMTTLDKAVAQPEPVPATVVEEIVVDENAPAPEPTEPAVEEGPQIADVSLNGAQVSSLLEIVAQYNAGLLTAQGAQALIVSAFPGIPPANAAAIVAGTSSTPVQTDRPQRSLLQEPEARTCGANAPGGGGFQPGNKCGGGEGGSADAGGTEGGHGQASAQVKAWADRKFSDPEHAKAFTQWFGDSKVVDEKGEPLVVYHGTRASFDEFTADAAGSNIDSGKLGQGFYFTTRPELAGAYATGGKSADKSGAKTISAHLAIRNPLEIDTEGGDLFSKLRDYSKQAGIKEDPLTADGNPNPSWSKQFTKRMRDFGYDGVALKISDSDVEYVAFDPTQIKSATGNSGTFDPNDPRITRGSWSASESRALTLSIDFDRTFAADPQLWGEFARKAVADGNTVVMVSRRPDTEEDRQTVTATLGDYADAFSQVLLVGDRMKDEAAREAGVTVDVWVDDSPQFIRSEERAEPGTVAEGDFVSWGSAGGRARGRIVHVMDYGTLDIPDTDFKIEASEEDPAALITVYEEVSGGWRATETQVGHKVSTLTKIDPLPEPPAEEKAYGKPKRKPRKRKADDGGTV